ncbi:MAG: hypothetical protein GF405_08415 [Candidatus Eisenbacteria bacterium]|nr:hypothetical protein [Candidatus Eisenbacteria bacterium]
MARTGTRSPSFRRPIAETEDLDTPVEDARRTSSAPSGSTARGEQPNGDGPSSRKDEAPGSRRARLVDYIFLLRPTALVPAWVFVARGARLALAPRPFDGLVPQPLLALALTTLTAVLAGGYILNQITDIESDRRNQKLFLLHRGIIPKGRAATLMIILWAVAGVLTLWLPPGVRWAVLAALVLNVTYSTPPIRAKARPWFDIAWNGLGFGAVSTVVGWFAVAPEVAWVEPGAFPLLETAGYAAAVAGLIASTTIPDVEGDRAEGLNTIGVALGARRTGLVALGLMSGAVAFAALSADAAGLVAALAGFGLLLQAQLRRSRAARVLASQWTVAAYVLVAAFFDPYLLVLLAIVVLSSRVYYRRRFDVAYPGRGTR